MEATPYHLNHIVCTAHVRANLSDYTIMIMIVIIMKYLLYIRDFVRIILYKIYKSPIMYALLLSFLFTNEK